MFPRDHRDYYKLLDLAENNISTLQEEIHQIKSSGVPTVKDNKESDKCRLTGNELFKQKKHLLALEQYNLSLCYAESNGLEQKMAYANRSALLFHKGYYQQCLEDIERALKFRYPEDKKAQLIKRKEAAEKLLPNQVKKAFHDECPQIINKNPLMPAASDAVKVARSDKYGRLLKATRDIKIGEVLIVEEPYVYITERNYRFRFCYECGELCFNMIPCENCLTMYCGEVCKQKAYQLYHKYECVVERHFGLYPVTPQVSSNGGISINALYADVKLPTKMTIRALFDLADKKHEVSFKGYHSGCYEEVAKLQTHEQDYVTNNLPKMKQLTGDLVKVYYLLTTYTDIKMKTKASDELIKSLLFHNAIIKLGNTFASFARKKNDVDEEQALHHLFNTMGMLVTSDDTEQQCFGTGIYPVVSLLNHCCRPDVEFLFYGKTLVVRAKRSVEAGKQIFTTYVPPYGMENRDNRRRQLLSNPFYFTCYCRVCKEDWPLLENRCCPVYKHAEFKPPYGMENRDNRRRQLLSNPFYFTCYCRVCKEDWPLLENRCCPVYKHAEFKYGPSIHTWKYNKEHYNSLKEIYELMFFKDLTEEEYPKYWEQVVEIYQKIKHEEPSPSFGFLDEIFEKVFFQYNKIVKF